MKWNELSPRERDALVATHIFGTQVEHLTQREYRFTNEEGEEEVHELLTGYATLGKCGYQLIPHYTTDMSTAWQVLQHLATRYNPKSRYDYEPFNRLTDALLGEREEIYPSHDCMYEIAKWTPDRICLAALRAVGVTIEE